MALADSIPSIIDVWHLDETSDGSTSVTRVGIVNGKNLTAARTAVNYPSSATGKLSNGAAGFNTDGCYLTRADEAALSFGDVKQTLACWVKFDDLTSTQVVVGKIDFGASCEYGLVLVGGKLRYYAGSGFDQVESTVTLSTGTWYAVVGEHDDAANQIRIYVNGTKTTATLTTGLTDGTLAFRVGSDSITAGRFLKGTVDEIVLLKGYCWSDAEVTEWVNGGSGIAYEDWAGSAATSYTFTGPTSGLVNAASTNFTVTPNGDATGIVVTPATNGSGSFTPSSVTFSGATPATFTYTPTSTTGSPHTLSVTDNGGLTDPASIGYTVLSGTIAITAPVAQQFKLSSGGSATFTGSGTYTGSPATIQRQVDGGSWVTHDAGPSGGNWTGTFTLNVSDTDHTIVFRFSSDNSVSASVSNVACTYFNIAIGGQSNEAGRGTSNQVPYAPYGADTHKKKTNTGSGFATLSDPTGTDGSAAGSWAPHMMTALGHLMGHRGGLINYAVGNTTIANWQKGAGTGYYEALAAAVTAVGGATALMMGPWENDAAAGTSQTTYHSGIASFVASWAADFPSCAILWRTPQPISTGVATQPHQDAISAAIIAAYSDVTGLKRGGDVRVVPTAPEDTVHWLTDQKLAAVGEIQAAAIYTAVTPTGGVIIIGRTQVVPAWSDVE
jgi:hypothetical protein